MAKKSYNKIDHSKKTQAWNSLLVKFKPYSGYDVKDYYGVSTIKRKSGGMYSIKLIHDYDSNAKMSSEYLVEDFQKFMKYIEILEWFAKDDDMRPELDAGDIDLSDDKEEIPF